MPAPVSKVFDVALSTGRYVLYRYRLPFPSASAFDARPSGFALDEEGSPVWYHGVYGDAEPVPTFSEFAGYTERYGSLLLAVPRYDYGSRTLHLSALYSYADSQGPVHILLDDECTRIDRFFTPCGRKGYAEMLWHRFVFHDGELLHCFYWYRGLGFPMMHVVKLSPDLGVVYRGEVMPSGEAGRIVNAWVCRRASTHDYVGLIWTTGIGIPTQVHAIRRTSVEPYAAFDLMYDIDAMGGFWDGGVSAYVDDNCFAGLLLVNVNYVWNVYTFKWVPGQSFPPPLTLRTSFAGYPLFAAMVSPDDYVVAYLYYNSAEDRDELHIVGADSFTFYGDPYLTDEEPPLRAAPSHFLATPSGIVAGINPLTKGGALLGHALMYIPLDQHWRHMNRDREVRVKVGGCRWLADGSVACVDVGAKLPLGCYADGEGLHAVLLNLETGRLEDYLHLPSGARILKGEVDVPFTVPHFRETWSFPLITSGDCSYFTASLDGCRLVKLHLPSKAWKASEAVFPGLTEYYVKVKLVDGALHAATFSNWSVYRVTVHGETMSTMYEKDIFYDFTVYGYQLAAAPVWVSREGVTYVALVVAVDAESGKLVAHLLGEDGSIATATAESPDQIPTFPLDRSVDVDAWWDGSRLYAVVAATPLKRGYDAKLLWVKLDDQGFRYGVLRELRPAGYTRIDRRPMYALTTKVVVDGWESWRLLLEPDGEYIYPPRQWLDIGFYPLFSCEEEYPGVLGLERSRSLQEYYVKAVPLQASQDGSVVYSHPGFAVMEGSSTLTGDLLYILKAPSPPPPPPPPALPPARRLLTLFRGRVGGV